MGGEITLVEHFAALEPSLAVRGNGLLRLFVGSFSFGRKTLFLAFVEVVPRAVGFLGAAFLVEEARLSDKAEFAFTAALALVLLPAPFWGFPVLFSSDGAQLVGMWSGSRGDLCWFLNTRTVLLLLEGGGCSFLVFLSGRSTSPITKDGSGFEISLRAFDPEALGRLSLLIQVDISCKFPWTLRARAKAETKNTAGYSRF